MVNLALIFVASFFALIYALLKNSSVLSLFLCISTSARIILAHFMEEDISLIIKKLRFQLGLMDVKIYQ